MATKDETLDLLRRDGHLHELTVDRYRAGELDHDERRFVVAHLEACEVCCAALARQEEFDRAFRSTSRAHPRGVPRPTRGRRSRLRRRRAVVAAGALALAAALALVVWAPVPEHGLRSRVGTEQDTVRSKGSGFAFEVVVLDDAGQRAARDGETVHPGDRLGFRVHLSEPGWLMVAGVDDRANTYLCYPQTNDGVAARLEPHGGGHDLAAAVRLDNVLGREHIVALFCPRPFDWEEFERPLVSGRMDHVAPAMGTLLGDCSRREVFLVKSARQ